MNDLSDLEWSSKPTGAQPRQPPVNMAPFSSIRPTPSPLSSNRGTPLPQQPSASTTPVSQKPTGDSFSNLMNFGPTKSSQNLSLAERQAQLEAEKRKQAEEKRKQAEAQYGTGQFWDSLGSRGATASPAFSAPPQPPPKNDDEDLFAAFNKDTKVDKASHYPPPDSRRSTPAAQLDLSQPGAWTSNGAGKDGGFPDDDDDPFGLNEIKSAKQAPVKQMADDDDFLGDLGRPVDEVRRERQTAKPEPGKPIEEDDSSFDEEPRRPNQPPRSTNTPIDHAVAQLMDYGFSPEQARRGLKESGAGTNVEAAANWLLDDAHRQAKAKSQGRNSLASSQQPSRGNNKSPAAGDADLAKSAAAVGNSLFKSANSLWKTSQKKVQQAVADFNQEGDPNQPKWMRDAQAAQSKGRAEGPSNATDEALALESGGRPKPTRSNSRPAAEPRPQPARGPSPAVSASSRSSPVPRWQQSSTPPVMSSARSRLDRLATDDDDSFAISAGRRKKPTPTPTPPPKPQAAPEPEADLLFNSQAPKAQPLPQRPTQRPSQPPSRSPAPRPTPSPRPMRQIPPISPVALQTSTKHRLAGTLHFKRGDYASAHASYSSSLTTIPTEHPLMILLLTNRALTALKTGEPKQAVTDADSALKLIGPGNGQDEKISVQTEAGADETRDMKDLYGKALSRKAEALEQMEKWADAGTVWQLCVECGAGGPNAIKGRQRCQAALAPKPKAAPKPAAKPRPRATAAASLAPQKDSEAVTRLRAANQAAEKEDDERFALSEKVDARLSAWRDGKRDNLRALIGSLDQVLWDNSGWKKVGLHELVMANKVKVSYMKAIAKTHPDKIPQDATTEMRLIAGSVFSTLNEAWDKFKGENGL